MSLLFAMPMNFLGRNTYKNVSAMYDTIDTGMRLVMTNMVYSFDWSLHIGGAGKTWYFSYVITDKGITKRGGTFDDMRSKQRHMESMRHCVGNIAKQVYLKEML